MDYYTIPTVDQLLQLPASELRRVPGLTVGRTGYGQVRFDVPVDLASIEEDLTHLAGGMVVFRNREVFLYPSADERAKRPNGTLPSCQPVPLPPTGQGLNQVATGQLDRCWVRDPLTRQYIQNVMDSRFGQNLNKMRSTPGTRFVDFEPSEGTWHFTVFSWWGSM